MKIGSKNLVDKVVYNPNDHGVEIIITLPSNTGFELCDLVEMIQGYSLVYTAEDDISMGSERIQEPIVEVKLK